MGFAAASGIVLLPASAAAPSDLTLIAVTDEALGFAVAPGQPAVLAKAVRQHLATVDLNAARKRCRDYAARETSLPRQLARWSKMIGEFSHAQHVFCWELPGRVRSTFGALWRRATTSPRSPSTSTTPGATVTKSTPTMSSARQTSTSARGSTFELRSIVWPQKPPALDRSSSKRPSPTR